MPILTLRDISKDNWLQCIQLEVADNQKNFVASNAKSLAQAAYEDHWRPQGIYADDEMVGFIMYGNGVWGGREVWVIARLMLAEGQQGKGYGTQAIRLALDVMRADKNPATDVYISFMPENDAARHIYSKLGFQNAGYTPDGKEILLHLTLDQSSD